jgi:hypothetical protein
LYHAEEFHFGESSAGFLFQNFKEQILLRKQIFSAIINLYLFSRLSAQTFFKQGRRGHSSPYPSFPRRPSGFREALRNCVSNFAQNGFALNSEYATKNTPVSWCIFVDF